MSWLSNMLGIDKIKKTLFNDYKDIISTIKNSINLAKGFAETDTDKLKEFVGDCVLVVSAYEDDIQEAIKNGITNDPFKEARAKAKAFKLFWGV